MYIIAKIVTSKCNYNRDGQRYILEKRFKYLEKHVENHNKKQYID